MTARRDADLIPVVEALANDEPPERRFYDHALTGDWRDRKVLSMSS